MREETFTSVFAVAYWLRESEHQPRLAAARGDIQRQIAGQPPARSDWCERRMRLRSGGLAVPIGILPFVHDDRAVRHPPSYFLMGRRNLPRYVLITEARRSDVKMADAFPLNPGSIVVSDRG
jgi:hypothetical protein